MYEYNEDDKKIDFSHNPFFDASGRSLMHSTGRIR